MASRAPRKNAFYAQSGGVTAVINASAFGVIETARAHRDVIGNVHRVLTRFLLDQAGLKADEADSELPSWSSCSFSR